MYNKLLLTLSIFVFIACGGGAPQEAQVVNIGSLGSEMKYDVEEFTVKAGSKVKIVLKNKKEIGTSLGATNLFDIKKKNKLDMKSINKYQNKTFKNVYNIWEENLYKKKLFNKS